jgi:hypothetical protein
MTTQTATLTEFLLARIAEDETAARGACILYRAVGEHQNIYGDWVPIEPVGSEDRDQVERTASFYRERGARNVEVVEFYDPARVLAECEAKRRIIGDRLFRESQRPDVLSIFGERIMSTLALPYADHPDYRQEWTA